MYFLQFRNLLEKGVALHLNKLECPPPKDALLQFLVEIGRVALEKKIFFIFVNVFSLFRNYLSIEKGGHFIWTNLNPLHLSLLCAKFGWNRRSGHGEEDLLNTSMYFRYFVIISPWK